MERVAIIGTGTMGHSIALCIAWANEPVTLYGMSNEDIQLAKKGIVQKAQLLVDEGLAKSVTQITAQIAYTLNLEEAVANKTLIIEAIPETLSLKHAFYKKLEPLVGEETIIASNTSGLTPTNLAAQSECPQRFIVTHFWNPAHLIPLVEIVPGAQTSADTISRVQHWLASIHKKAIVVQKEVPGFIGNRLQFALLREAQALFEAGVATKEDIDAAVTYSIGRRLPVTGPLLSADLGGLDVYQSIAKYLYPDLSTMPTSPSLDKHAAANQFGVRTQRGYYEFDEQFTDEVLQTREKTLIHFLKMDRKGELYE